MGQLNKTTAQINDIITYLQGVTSGSEEGINIPTGAQVKCDAFVTNVLATLGYKAGQISYDTETLTNQSDTGIPGVRVQIGQETHYLVYNNTASPIANGKACYASGVDPTTMALTVGLADNSSFFTSAQVLGLATHTIGVGELGLVTTFGTVRDFDTTGLAFGLTYLGTNGDMVSAKPLHPANRVSMGAKLSDGVSDGHFHVSISNLSRRNAGKSYSFTSQGIGAGTYWKAGFYDFDSTDANLDEGSTTETYGIAGRGYAAHAAIVASGAGTVNTGQVGLRVTGVQDNQDGTPQQAGQTGIITEDITTLSGDTYYETSEKWSGELTFELYVVSGSPTAYSLDFNYGYAKYEDASDIDFTVTSFEAVWQANATGNSLDIALVKHASAGWTYAASGFEPGNGDICRKSVDMQIAGDTTNDTSGAYKRTNLNEFIDGNGSEGVLIKVTTSGSNTVQTMDMHIGARSEELF